MFLNKTRSWIFVSTPIRRHDTHSSTRAYGCAPPDLESQSFHVINQTNIAGSLTAQLPKQPSNMPALAPVSANTPAQHSSRLGGTTCPGPSPQTNAEGPVERPLACQLFRSNSAFAGDSDEASEEAAAPAHVDDAEVVARLRRRVSRLSTGEFDGTRISRRARAASPGGRSPPGGLLWGGLPAGRVPPGGAASG